MAVRCHCRQRRRVAFAAHHVLRYSASHRSSLFRLLFIFAAIVAATFFFSLPTRCLPLRHCLLVFCHAAFRHTVIVSSWHTAGTNSYALLFRAVISIFTLRFLLTFIFLRHITYYFHAIRHTASVASTCHNRHGGKTYDYEISSFFENHFKPPVCLRLLADSAAHVIVVALSSDRYARSY